MKRFWILLLLLFLLIGCICGCTQEPAESVPETSSTAEANTPLEHNPTENQSAQPSETAPPVTSPSGAPQPNKPQATEPQETTQQPTEPQATKPQKATVPATGTMIDNLTCTYSIGGGSEKTVENPISSDLYAYIRQARSNAQQKNPVNNNNNQAIRFSFKIGEKEISWLELYSDDYAAIPVTVELPRTQFYLFPNGTYQTILNTLNQA